MGQKHLSDFGYNPFLAHALYVAKDGTGQYNTIQSAIDIATADQVVVVGPGVYEESISVLASTILISAFGPQVTTIAGSSATGTRVTLGNFARIQGFTVEIPNDATPAISYSGPLVSVVSSIILEGTGSLGIGIENDGSGILVVNEVSYTAGTCDAIIENSGSGETALSNFRINGGTINDGIKATLGMITVNSFVSTAPGVTDAIHVGAGSLEVSGLFIRDATNFIHVINDSGEINASGGIFTDTGTYHLLVDSGITSAKVFINSTEMSQSKISAPGVWLGDNSTHSIVFSEIDRDNIEFAVWNELSVGHPESGSEFNAGQGDDYTRGLIVFTTDATATPTTDGGNFNDVSSSATSESGSTFTFQGLLPNNTILIGTTLEDTSDVIKHWGLEIIQTTAAVEIVPKSFAFEIWDGSQWTEINVMSIHDSLKYRYANEIFIRSNTREDIRYGITETTTWSKKLINGQDLYWVRIRIKNALTTAPVFEQFKLTPNRFQAIEDGTNVFHGSSRFRETLLSTGNVFGESGGVVDADPTIGSGGLPTEWDHNIKNSLLNNNGDAIYAQFALPKGIDTSMPLFIEYKFRPTDSDASNVTLIASLLPMEVEGVMEADPTGGTAPVARTLANTAAISANAAETDTEVIVIGSNEDDRIHSVKFGGFDVSDYYEGDMIAIRIELDDDGTGNQDIETWTLAISGVKWTHGER